MTHTTSKFGVEYDSLSDLVAFGVAPAILAYSWSLAAFGKWGWLAAAMYVTCGALRLARFNVQVGVIDSRYFNGLAIPAAAIVVSSTVLLYYYLGYEGTFPHLSILVGMMALSLLMVSSIKFYSFKDLHFLTREPFMTVVLAVILLIIVSGGTAGHGLHLLRELRDLRSRLGNPEADQAHVQPGEKAADARRGDQNGIETRGDIVIENKPDHDLHVL